MSLGVRFDSFHTDDWDLTLTDVTISEPVPDLKYIYIPGRPSPIDASEVLGEVTYKNRTAKYDLEGIMDQTVYESKRKDIQKAIAGRKIKIFQDSDPDWYWYGRPTVSSQYKDGKGNYTITATIDPYQYRESADDWIWDTFNFENGMVVDHMAQIQVDGSETVSFLTTYRAVLTVTASADMTLAMDGSTYTLPASTPVSIRYEPPASGTTQAVITGTGTVSITIREEVL